MSVFLFYFTVQGGFRVSWVVDLLDCPIREYEGENNDLPKYQFVTIGNLICDTYYFLFILKFCLSLF